MTVTKNNIAEYMKKVHAAGFLPPLPEQLEIAERIFRERTRHVRVQLKGPKAWYRIHRRFFLLTNQHGRNTGTVYATDKQPQAVSDFCRG